jgi:hypothetical protein
MKLKDADIKDLHDKFEEALNRAQRLDKQHRQANMLNSRISRTGGAGCPPEPEHVLAYLLAGLITGHPAASRNRAAIWAYILERRLIHLRSMYSSF